MSFKKLITKKVEFSASHRYWNPDWDDEKNKEIFGKNTSPLGHGHNFHLEVTVEGEIDNHTGMVINLFDLKAILAVVLEKYDHKYLNEDLEVFKKIIPTPENIAKQLWDDIETELENWKTECTLYKVRLYETPDLYVDYWKS
ncbi:MAG: 6-carboxytetrahydropterin synthase [Thermodesulfobacteriota bacterium]